MHDQLVTHPVRSRFPRLPARAITELLTTIGDRFGRNPRFIECFVPYDAPTCFAHFTVPVKYWGIHDYVGTRVRARLPAQPGPVSPRSRSMTLVFGSDPHVAEPAVGFSVPPPYPYDRCARSRPVCRFVARGVVDCSIGTRAPRSDVAVRPPWRGCDCCLARFDGIRLRRVAPRFRRSRCKP